MSYSKIHITSLKKVKPKKGLQQLFLTHFLYLTHRREFRMHVFNAFLNTLQNELSIFF